MNPSLLCSLIFLPPQCLFLLLHLHSPTLRKPPRGFQQSASQLVPFAGAAHVFCFLFFFPVITVIVCAPVRAACGLDVQLMRGQGCYGGGTLRKDDQEWPSKTRGEAFTSPPWSRKTGLRCINSSITSD